MEFKFLFLKLISIFIQGSVGDIGMQTGLAGVLIFLSVESSTLLFQGGDGFPGSPGLRGNISDVDPNSAKGDRGAQGILGLVKL